MTPIGAIILIVAVVMVWTAPPEKALLAMVAGALFLSQGLQLNLGGFNMFAFRFIELTGFLRVLTRKEFSFSQLNKIDRMLIGFYAYLTIVFVLRSSEGVIFEIGVAVDAFLTYFTFRGLVKNMDNVIGFLRSFLVMFSCYAVLVMLERYFRYNAFILVGGDGPGDPDIWDRNGMPRCYGSFRHPSLLGTIGGSFLPLYFALWLGPTKKKAAIIGMACCLLIVFASNSGAPLNCVAVGFVGWVLWLARKNMRAVRWILVIFVTVMGFAMKAPIWYLVAKASDISGGDGWHRSYLMDIAYQNLGNWWFAGMPLEATRHWFPYTNGGTGNADITNQYISYGLTAGLGVMALFIAVLTTIFSQLGKAMQLLRSRPGRPGQTEFLLWGLGTMIGIHCVNWFGITYFDQTYVFWFLQLAIISCLTTEVLQPTAKATERHLQIFTSRV